MAKVETSIEVDVPVRTAYNQWTQFEEFPQFMEGVEQVQQLDDTHLRWEAEIAGKRHEWEAEITEQKPDERVAWTSTDGKTNAGVVTFHRLDENRSQGDGPARLGARGHGRGDRGRRSARTSAACRATSSGSRSSSRGAAARPGAWRGEVEQGRSAG